MDDTCSAPANDPTSLRYPATRTVDTVDDYHGTSIPDPYRWLEASDGPEVRSWVEAQNAVTRAYLDADPRRREVEARLTALWDYPKEGLPLKRGGRYFSFRNSGLQDQSVLYLQDRLDGEAREVLDPNGLSPDGTVALTNLELTEDGTLMAYGLSQSGSDWQEIRVRDVDAGADRPDLLQWVRFSGLAWTHDNDGLYYARYSEPGTVPEEDEHYYQKLYYHSLGDDQEQDRLIYERPEDRLLGFSPGVTQDGRYLLVHVSRGTDKNNEIFVQRIDRPGEPIQPLMTGFDASYQFLEAIGDTFYFRTDRDAPRGRIVAVDVERPEPSAWRTIVPESEDVLDFGAIVNGRLIVGVLHDAHHLLRMHDLDGGRLSDIELPAIGSISGVSGRPDQEELFVGFTSFVFPQAIYRYDFADEQLHTFREPRLDFDREPYVTRQVAYESRDGTRVPMFLVHRKELPANGANPVRLYGYGGFNINITPSFSPAHVLWLENGGVLAYPSLRGGAEFGEEWHAAGMLERKQNVFDDFIGAAEWLVANDVTRPERLAIQGGSNGGLLVGACLVQRPDLFGAAVAQVPVLDMLRYHRWTIGRYWIPEYGSSEEPEQFPYLHAYSPYHNLRPAPYPATLITTGDTDDRVDPAHARKFAAMLQEVNKSAAPTLLRVETRAGHGAGKPTSKLLEEAADIYAFLIRRLGMEG